MKLTATNLTAETRRCAPAAIGNGDLSILIDHEGLQHQNEDGYGIIQPGIRRAGFRYDTRHGELIPFGRILHEMEGLGELLSWEQSLDNQDGLIHCRCDYRDGTRIESTIFCHLERNILAIRRRISTGLAAPYRLRYLFAPRHARIETDSSGTIHYEVDGAQLYRGTITFSMDASFRFLPGEGEYGIETGAREFTLLVRFDDDEPAAFDELLASTRRLWQAYWQESYIRVPSPEIQQAYETAQYLLRISSTRWSLPTGIYDSHWHGRYFAFDEYFTFMGLVTSGHMREAAKIPHFRFSLLPGARRRVEGDNPRSPVGIACYPWESDEAGEENSPRGFWYDHIFQASHIALAAWELFRFSGDRDLLRRELYPLIGASCEWLRNFHIVHDEQGRTVIGCCTDLERLGPVRFNPFMTSCSVIAALEAAAQAAELLDVNPQMVPLWRKLAAELRTTLPRENGRYIPFAGCTTHSIGQLAGIYPYAVLSKKDPAQLAAIRDYADSKAECGNMYQLGSGICSWYLCWEAITCARLGDGEAAFRLLEETARQTGSFGEMFEIYECGIRPWFTTAAGKFIQAVNEMLLQFENGVPKPAPAVPAHWREFAFRLQNLGGGRVEAEFQDGRKAAFRILPPGAE